MDLDWSINRILGNDLYESQHDLNRAKKDEVEWIYYGREHKKASVRPAVKRRATVRLTGSLNSIPAHIRHLLLNVGNLDFDCFDYSHHCNNRELNYLMTYLFEESDFYAELKISSDIFINFVNAIEAGYPDNPYHNRIHAADVT